MSTHPLPSSEEHPFAPYVRILGKGKSGTRSLTEAESFDAFSMILQGNYEAVQLGAFLMLLRVKEETPQEIAGFVRACRQFSIAPPPELAADLDWSTYAGKRHQHPWYLLSLWLLAGAGYRVFVHGSAGHTAGRLYTESAMRQLGLPIAANWQEVDAQLTAHNLSYLPLQRFCAPLDDIIQLRPLLGLRSPVNTLTRLLNPLSAPSSIQSIFHPAYAEIHQLADQRLEQPRALVIKGESGEIEVKPHADTRIVRLLNGQQDELKLERVINARVAAVTTPAVEPVRGVWRGDSQDRYGECAVIGTTAVALLVLQPQLSVAQARDKATALWNERNTGSLG